MSVKISDLTAATAASLDAVTSLIPVVITADAVNGTKAIPAGELADFVVASIGAGELAGTVITTGTLDGTAIAAGTLTATEMAAGAAAANIAANELTAGMLAAGAAAGNIGAGEIADTMLAAGAAVANIGAGGITTTEIGAGAVDLSTQVTGTLSGASVGLTSGALLVGDVTNAGSDLVLTSGQIIVGSAAGIATAVAVSGDATMDDTGAFTVAVSLGGLAVTTGALVTGAAGVGSELMLTAAQIVIGDASGYASAATMSGDATLSDTGVLTLAAGVAVANIGAGGITSTELAAGAAATNIVGGELGPAVIALPQGQMIVGDAGGTGLALALTAGQIIVADASGFAAAVTMSGDATISDAGVLTLSAGAAVANIGAGGITTTEIGAGAVDLATQVSGTLSGASIGLTSGALLVGDVSNAGSNLVLTSGQIIVGSAAGIATAVAVSGDATMDDTGAFTIAVSLGGLAVTTGAVVVGAAGVGSELVITDGQMIIGNASSEAVAVTMGGDATIDNTGIVSVNSLQAGVAAGNLGTDEITETMMATGSVDLASDTVTGLLPLANLDMTWVDSEVPTGTVNGTNDVFTLANTPITGSEHIYVNGSRQSPTTHYTIAADEITFVTPPSNGADLLADYRY
jgi:hypothetical protein